MDLWTWFFLGNVDVLIIDSCVQVTQYLLDKTLIMDEDTLYDLSLKIEPRLPAWGSAARSQYEPAGPGWKLQIMTEGRNESFTRDVSELTVLEDEEALSLSVLTVPLLTWRGSSLVQSDSTGKAFSMEWLD